VLRDSVRTIVYRRLLVDVLATAATFLLAHQLRSTLLPRLLPAVFPRGLYPLVDYLPLLAVVLVVWAFLLAAQGLATPGEVVALRHEVLRTVRVPILGALLVAAAGYLFRFEFVSRPFLLLFALLNAIVLALMRVAERRTAWGRRLTEAPERVVVVVGCSGEALRMARLVASHRAWGFTLKGLVDADGCGRESVEEFPILGSVGDLPELLTNEVIDEVVLAVPTRRLGELEDVLLRCQELGVRVRVALQPFPHLQPRIDVELLEGVPLLTFATMPTAPLPLFAKRIFDIAAASLVLLATTPLWPLVAVAVRFSSPGPVLFRQQRCGLAGRRFVLLKFRTMVADAEQQRDRVAHLNAIPDGPSFKAPSDPRITRVGRVLRRFSLDELPQLVNVLRGQMSLVGPRPPIPAEVAKYEPWQRRRLAMKPGMTGLWQVSGRADLDFATTMELDLAYLDHWSLWLDLKILLRTVPAVLWGRGAA
jgi:exopolysaccharide biosynthesis polyprenyl glycosylphosphotransferase